MNDAIEVLLFHINFGVQINLASTIGYELLAPIRTLPCKFISSPRHSLLLHSHSSAVGEQNGDLLIWGSWGMHWVAAVTLTLVWVALVPEALVGLVELDQVL